MVYVIESIQVVKVCFAIREPNIGCQKVIVKTYYRSVKKSRI